MKHNVKVIQCSSDRCNNCPKQVDLECKDLSIVNQNEEQSTLLIERNRGLLHFRFSGDPVLTEPPWQRDGWESVFIGKESKIFHSITNLIEIYHLDPYISLFFDDDYQVKYQYLPIVSTVLEFTMLSDLENEYRKTKRPILKHRENHTDNLTHVIMNISNHIKEQIPEINELTRLRLAQIVAHRTSIFGRIIPILLDERTEEVYMDSPNSPIYFDHQKLGRCVTSSRYSDEEIPRIMTFLRSESNLHLDRSNPSLKMDLQLLGSILRVSVSVPPLSSDGLSLEIRRARIQPFTILNLIENNTMTREAAAILLLAISSRLNITITGGPGTGKTTLLNALDQLTPRWWRKVYIEDAIESRISQNRHQVRLQVDPVDEFHKKLSKSEEIIKCLHRSPDYLILGEIQTVEHSVALFQAIAAGLHSIQTCHSDSSSSLISRWILGHNIDRSNVGLMDVIVTLERPKPGESKRQVKEIVEIRKGTKDGLLTFEGTNIVYDNTSKKIGPFAEDGAFRTLAKDVGIENHEQALNSLITSLYNDDKIQDLERLSESMWTYGHPMRFIV
jgi:type IV secretory pathway ATPase VirB11/archaellum biosynthesis ATPase